MKHAPARLTAATRLAAATRIAAATLLAALLAACGSNSPQLPPGPPSDPAGISVRPLPNESFEGSVYWELNASELLEGEPVARYLWRFGDLEVESWTDTVYRGYGREGTYEVGLTATLESGGTVEGEATVAVDDLPYDYWGEPSLLVNATGSGEKLALPFLVHFDVSDDGRFVAFTTEAAALPSDTNGASDVYVKDLESGELFLVSADGGGATVGQGPVAISSDGAFVAYRYGEVVAVVEMASGASRLIDDPDGYATVEPLAFSSDGLRLLLNARTLNDPVRTGYVVHLLPTPTFTRLGGVGGGAFVNVNAVDLSSHGNVAVFRSQHAFVPEDDNGLYDVYAYDVTADEVRLVSADSTGVVGNRLSEAHGPVVSADGRYVTFFSASSNFPRAGENGAALPVDYVYVKDLQTGALTP